MSWKFSVFWSATLCLLTNSLKQSCIPRNYGFGSVVCVCNVSYCDQLGHINHPPSGIVRLYETSKDGARFLQRDIRFASTYKQSQIQITIDRSSKLQTIIGFGGAFTDAAGINILSLPKSLQDQLLESYYSANGSDYTIGRIPMASCDFSTHVYSYDDYPGDFNLKHFSLTAEDLQLKIPLIHRAQYFRSDPIKLFASPWSSPGWMKDTGNMSGPGVLKGKPGGKYYQTWAEYFLKFLQAYQAHNIELWGITAENEPIEGFWPHYSFQAMGFTAETQRDFIKLNLGPTLKNNGYGPNRLNLMILDDQRYLLPHWAYVVLNDTEALQYVSGIAFHWYGNNIAPPEILDSTHKAFPDRFLLSTEACSESSSTDKDKVKLGSWDRGENYSLDIIKDLLHWTTGWVDWNLALNEEGGPNWAKNFVDSPIIVNSTAKEFYKQPMYYALAHFSKFLPPRAVRIQSSYRGNTATRFYVVGFERPDNLTVAIIVNGNDAAVSFSLHDSGKTFNSISPPHSIQSYIWQ